MTFLSKVLSAIALLIATTASVDAAESNEIWNTHCAKCHGSDGAGKTVMGKKLKLKDLTAVEVQDVLTDAAISSSITDGIRNDAGKLIMPVFAEKVPAENIAGLVEFVRRLRKEK